MNNKCIYYVEGPCEQQLIAALKENPAKLIPGKIKVFNVIQNLIPKSQMLSIQTGTTVVLVFDTDVEQTAKLKKNLDLLTRYCGELLIVFLPQVLNLEDELVRCTDVSSAADLTRSNSIRNFKNDCSKRTKLFYLLREGFVSLLSCIHKPKRPAPHATPALGQAALFVICSFYNSCISRTIWLCFRLLRQMLL